MSLLRTYLLLLLVLFTIKASSQVKFYAEIPERTIGKSDYLQLSFTVENANKVDEITPPSFKNFQLVSGPSQQSSMSNINGVVKRTISLVYVLKPLRTGSFTIGPATASADGHELRSEPISVSVTNSSSASAAPKPISPFSNLTLDELTVPARTEYDDYILRKGERVEDKIKKNLFIKVDVSRSSCHIGEPIIATYKLYSRLKSESNVIKMPSFNGFSVSDLEKPESFTMTNEKYKGRDYNVYIIRKVELYPLLSGNIVLEPAEVENRITFIKADAKPKNTAGFYGMMQDFADDNMMNADIVPEKVIIRSEPVTIKVDSLPENNKPKDFKGATGDFRITASLEKSNISGEDAGKLIITIAGEGNIHMINAPIVNNVSGLQFYEPSAKENIDKMTVPFKGSKSFIYPFTVSSSGKYTIPRIAFSFFDNSKNAYRTISSEPVTLQVDNATPGTKKKDTIIANYSSSGLFGRFKWAAISAIALLIVLAIWISKAYARKKPIDQAAPPPYIAAKEEQVSDESLFRKQPLADVEAILFGHDSQLFYSTLNCSLRNYLSEKFNIAPQELSRKRINELLDKNNVGIGTGLLLCSLLENIERSLYMPAIESAQIQEDYEKANEVISLLEKQVSHTTVNL
jgi:hypothetical protein